MKQHYFIVFYLVLLFANSLLGVGADTALEKGIEIVFEGSIVYPEHNQEKSLLPFNILRVAEGTESSFFLYLTQARYMVPLTRLERFKGGTCMESFQCLGGSFIFYRDKDGDCVKPEFFDKNAQKKRIIAEKN